MIRTTVASEKAEAWGGAVKKKDSVPPGLPPQKLGFIYGTKYGSAAGLAKGAYVLADTAGGTPQVVLMSSGSEVSLILEAQQKLEVAGIRARAVSMPSHELFARQSDEYRNS